MRVDARLSGLDKLRDEISSQLVEGIDKIADESVHLQQVSNETPKKTYLNHTCNLRNAPGYSVVVNGKEVKRNILADAAHPEAKAATDKLLDSIPKEGTGLIIADGMEYASYVDANGYDVLDTALWNAHKKLNE